MKEKKYIYLVLFISLLVFIVNAPLDASHKGSYPIKRPHEGINVKPKKAYELISKDPNNSYIVDVRSRIEYQDVGHPVGSYNIPAFFYTNEVGKKGYKMIPNENFCNDLKGRFNQENDSLFMICRSGERSTTAVIEAIKCGFSKDKVYNVLGGFEGDKVHEEGSPFTGMRMVGGWRLEGLPWTYKMDPIFLYLPDIKNK
jgi:rhodanese-related sulfurtransferase